MFTDSFGEAHGEGFGELLSSESDFLKVKYQRRHKLKSIAEAHAFSKPHKREKILKNNLGRQKLDARTHKHTQRIRDKVFKAVHSVVDKAKGIVTEDLSHQIRSQVFFSKNQKRRLSGWVKGIIKEAVGSVSQRRGSSLVFVNASYTSQMDSRFGVLLGHLGALWAREKFYCFDGVVLDADENAARNILARNQDPEIRLWTPYKQVKSILLERTEIFKANALNGWDCSSKTPVAI